MQMLLKDFHCDLVPRSIAKDVVVLLQAVRQLLC